MADAARHTEDFAATRMAASHDVALELGWQLFKPFMPGRYGSRAVRVEELRRASLQLMGWIPIEIQ